MKKVFDEIRKAKPIGLFVIADGLGQNFSETYFEWFSPSGMDSNPFPSEGDTNILRYNFRMDNWKWCFIW